VALIVVNEISLPFELLLGTHMTLMTFYLTQRALILSSNYTCSYYKVMAEECGVSFVIFNQLFHDENLLYKIPDISKHFSCFQVALRPVHFKS